MTNNFHDLNTFKSLRYSEFSVENQIEFTNERILESLDFSNKTGFSESLVGRAINGIFSMLGKNLNKGTLLYFSNKLFDEYMNGLLVALEKKNVLITDIFEKKTYEQLIVEADELFKTYSVEDEKKKTDEEKIKYEELRETKLKEALYTYQRASILDLKNNYPKEQIKKTQEILKKIYSSGVIKNNNPYDNPDVEVEETPVQVQGSGLFGYNISTEKLEKLLNDLNSDNINVKEFVYLLVNKYLMADEYDMIVTDFGSIVKNNPNMTSQFKNKTEKKQFVDNLFLELTSVKKLLNKVLELLKSYKKEKPKEDEINNLLNSDEKLKKLGITFEKLNKYTEDKITELYAKYDKLLKEYNINLEVSKQISLAEDFKFECDLILEAFKYNRKSVNLADFNEVALKTLLQKSPEIFTNSESYVNKSALAEIEFSAEDIFKIKKTAEGADVPGRRRNFVVTNQAKEQLEQFWKILVAKIMKQFEPYMNVGKVNPIIIGKSFNESEIKDGKEKTPTGSNASSKINKETIKTKSFLNIVDGKAENDSFGILDINYSTTYSSFIYESQAAKLYGRNVYRFVKSIAEISNLVNSETLDEANSSIVKDDKFETFIGLTKETAKYGDMIRLGVFLIKADNSLLKTPDKSDVVSNSFNILIVYGSKKLFNISKTADGKESVTYNKDAMSKATEVDYMIRSYNTTTKTLTDVSKILVKPTPTVLNVKSSYKITNKDSYSLKNIQIPFNIFESNETLKTNLISK